VTTPDYAAFGAGVAGRLDVYVRQDDGNPVLTLSGIIDFAERCGITIGQP